MANDKPESSDGASNDRNYRDDGTDQPEATSDTQPELNFDDDEVMSGRGNSARTGGTWQASGADSGKLAPPREILSDRNGPSDNDSGGKKRPS